MQGMLLYLTWILLGYFALYNVAHLFLTVLAFIDVRQKLHLKALDDYEILESSPYTPPVSILVPAFNEAVTIVSSLQSLIALRFPSFEIIVVNDGSEDDTLEVLQEAWKLRRRDVPFRAGIATASIRGLYEATLPMPASVLRLVVIDKDQGGKADALNAGINVSACPYIISMDADSLIDDKALSHIFRVLIERKDVAAVGGQVVVANGCTIQNGRVETVGLPKSHLARMQIVEYVRSFTMARTALSKLNALLIISGVFCIFEKNLLIQVGGYLTHRLRSRLAHEYAGRNASTVCEDMEIVVRLHRYIREKKLRKSILSLPYPVCWTEVPERAADLEKQRSRWFRGFMEIMMYHRQMLFNPRFGAIGLLGWPWLVLFDFFGLFIEAIGYLSLPILTFFGIISQKYLVLFMILAFGYGSLISMLSLLVAFWSEPTSHHDYRGHTLLAGMRNRERALLLAYCVLENFGYRQLTVFWRLKGMLDYLRRKKGWEKFERIGFAIGEPTS